VDPNGGFNTVAVAPDGQIALGDYNKRVIRLVSDLTTKMLVPSTGARVSSTAQTLDAGAYDASSDASKSLQFEVTGNGLSNDVVATGQLSLYGWVGRWDTTKVPNGTYGLQSIATDAAGNTAVSPRITVTVQN
jgi:hypothetical protein